MTARGRSAASAEPAAAGNARQGADASHPANNNAFNYAAVGGRVRLGLLALSMVTIGAGIFSTSLVDRDEGWYAQVSREMVATGDWLIPTYLGEPWIAKPPLLYWCVAGLFAVFGESAGVARLVVVLAALGCVQLVATLGAALFSRRAGIIAAVTYATAGLPVIVHKLLLTDSLLLLWTLCACVLLLRFVERRRSLAVAAGFWVCIGLGVLTKGPAIFVFVGGFALGLLWWREARAAALDWRIWALLPVGVVVGGWWYVLAAQEAGATLWEQFVGYEILSRLTDPPRDHTGPFGYYFVLGVPGWLPWTLLIPGAVVEIVRDWRRERAAAVVLVWWVVPWVALELIESKLPHYILPVYVPLALLLGRMWDAGAERETTRAQRGVLWAWLGLLAVILLGIAGVGVYAIAIAGAAHPAALAAVVIGVVLAGATVGVGGWYARRGRLIGVFASVAGVMVAFHGALGWWLLPSLEGERVSVAVARAANAAGVELAERGIPAARWGAEGTGPEEGGRGAQVGRGEGGPQAGGALPEPRRVLVSGYAEPSVFFYLRARGERVSAEQLAERVAAGAHVVIATPTVLEAAGVVPGADWVRVRGLNYVKGEWVEVWVGVGE